MSPNRITFGNQLTLGALIKKLESFAGDEPVKYDFVHLGPTTLASYRGYYEDLALGYADPDGRGYEFPKVAQLLEVLRGAIGKTFTGWKGGDYRMVPETPVWVANAGETGGTAIVDVEMHTYVTLITALVD